MRASKAEVCDVLKYTIENSTIKASYHQWKILNAVTMCRTSALGGHLYECSHCEHSQPRYNSCRNRHCPKCQGADIAKWTKARESELLDVPYFHTVFTVPHELNELFLNNKAEMFSILFKAVNITLKETTKTRYGGTAGFFAVLHTWGQKMDFHPHVHCVIPGVLLKDQTVLRSPVNYFLPNNLLAKVFRGVFLSLVKDNQKLKDICAQKQWVVYSKKPFTGPQAVIKYLARYTHRVAISNARILALQDGKVRFRYKDYSNKAKNKTLTLSAAEFTRRFLLHVLPHNFVRIRHLGFMASRNKKSALSLIRDSLCESPTGVAHAKVTNICCPSCKDGILLKSHKIQPSSLNTHREHCTIKHRAKPPPAHSSRRSAA